MQYLNFVVCVIDIGTTRWIPLAFMLLSCLQTPSFYDRFYYTVIGYYTFIIRWSEFGNVLQLYML